MPFQLPKEPQRFLFNGIPANLNLLVFGRSKVGKTTFAAQWKDCIVGECEDGGADTQNGYVANIRNLKELNEFLRAVETSGKFKAFALDTLDKIAEWVEDELCEEYKISSIMQAVKGAQNGVQWTEYKLRIRTLVKRILSIPDKQKIILAHTRKPELDQTGNVLSPNTINVYGQTAALVCSMVDNIGYLFAHKTGNVTSRYLSFRADVMTEVGSRHPALRDQIIDLPLTGSYQKIEKLFLPQGANK